MVAENLLTLLAVAGCLCAAALDLRHRRIPNWLTGPLACAGIALQFIHGGSRGALHATAGLLLCGSCFMLPYLAGGMGAGDVKLVAAEGALLGAQHTGALLCMTAFCGAVLAALVALRRGAVLQTVGNLGMLVKHHTLAGLQPHSTINLENKSAIRLPYALAIAGGVMLTVLPRLAEGSLR